MRASWHILAQIAVVGLGCSGEGETGADRAVERDAPEAYSCSKGNLFDEPGNEPFEREARSGTNGKFADTCQGGNLVQYECETLSTSVPETPETFPVGTGNVISKVIDCGGKCTQGICVSNCPEQGDTVQYASVAEDGAATLKDLDSGWTYACELYPEQGAHCLSYASGDTASVMRTFEFGCIGTVTFHVGLTQETICAYLCDATPP